MQNRAMIYGYARVSTNGQDLAQQLAQLEAAGCAKIYREKISGASAERPQLKRAIGALDPGDVLMVTATDRLARNTRDLLNILHAVKEAGAGFQDDPQLTHPAGRGGLDPFAPEASYVRDAGYVSGALLMIEARLFTDLGGFDDRYFMYMEDVDLCWRLWRSGWRVGYEPTARVVHAIGRSTDQTPYRMIAEHHRSLGRYFARTASGPVRLLLPLVRVALVLRTVLAWIQRLKRRRPHAAP